MQQVLYVLANLMQLDEFESSYIKYINFVIFCLLKYSYIKEKKIQGTFAYIAFCIFFQIGQKSEIETVATILRQEVLELKAQVNIAGGSKTALE